jgi:hypothetical protein
VTTFPLPTLSATINEFGVAAPSYADIFASLQAQVRAIYGTDTYLEPDSADGQLLSIVALAIHDSNQAVVAVYNAYSPATAIGAGLSSIVKINGLTRLIPSRSQVSLTIVGVAGTDVSGGKVIDDNGYVWTLPTLTIIDANGQITATAVCDTEGAIRADPSTVEQISTPIPGWQTATNSFAAAVGAPVESDATLRARQAVSSALPSKSVLDGINAGLLTLSGVHRLKTYENDQNTTDPDGIPPHAIAVVIEGGDSVQICNMIGLKKTPGCDTYGVVGELVYDEMGVENFIKFFPLSIIEVFVEVTLTALTGYSSSYGDRIIAQVADFITTLPIGYDVYLSKVIAATELVEPEGLTYEVTKVRMRRSGTLIWNTAIHGWNIGRWDGPFFEGDVDIGFNEAAETLTANVTLIVNTS